MSETHDTTTDLVILQEPNAESAYNMHPQTAADVLDFFLDSSGREGYEGYEKCAAALISGLDAAVVRARSESRNPEVRLLRLKPAEPREDPYRVPENKEPPATTALISLAYRQAGAESAILYSGQDARHKGHLVVRAGTYKNTPVYFTETIRKGNKLWHVRSDYPDSLIPSPQQPESRPFLTTLDEQEMRRSFHE